MRTRTVYTGALAVVAAAALAIPAFGGDPVARTSDMSLATLNLSPSSMFRGLKRTFKVADKARKSARQAQRTANRALKRTMTPGPAGPTGPTGPQGAQGAQGAPGPASVVVRHGTEAVVGGSTQTTQLVSATCGAGERALSGGAKVGEAPQSASQNSADPRAGEKRTFVVYSSPATDGQPAADGATPNGWLTEVTNTLGTTDSLARGYVTCAK